MTAANNAKRSAGPPTASPGVVARWFAGLSGFRADVTCLGLGIVAALALPPLHILPVLLVAIPGLIRLIDTARTHMVALRRGWWFGFGFHLVGLYWITEAILVEAARFWWLIPLAVPSLAAVLAVFVALAAMAARLAAPGWRRALALAGAWTLLDMARQFVLTGFPWNPFGSVLALPGYAGDVLIQPAAWIGVHGLTLAVVILAALPTLGWRWRSAGLAMTTAMIGVGMIRLSEKLPEGPAVTVVLVQGNVAQGRKWDRTFMLDIFHRYLRLTSDAVAAAGGGKVVVVWPETATPFALQTDPAARAAITDSGAQIMSLIGAVRFGADDRPRNSLFAMQPGGQVAGIYDKWHLVPFGEYQPDWLPMGVQLVPGGGFGRGDGPRTLHLPGVPSVGPLICYEAIFSGEIVDARDRPDWLVNVTNDAWFGDSSGPRQHLIASRLRSVEEGLPLMRAANTGISAAFDPMGREIARLGMNVQGSVTVRLPPSLAPTVFARFGLPVPICLSVTVFLIAMRLRNRSLR
jgi:apolipoprotein N-acyltransferase